MSWTKRGKPGKGVMKLPNKKDVIMSLPSNASEKSTAPKLKVEPEKGKLQKKKKSIQPQPVQVH